MQEITDCTHRNAVVHIADPACEDQRQADVTQVTARTGVLAEHPECSANSQHRECNEERSTPLADSKDCTVVEDEMEVKKIRSDGGHAWVPWQ
jgi:hypothetical protein